MMNPYYNDELPVMGGDEEVMVILGVMLAIFGIIALFALILALLRSWGLYTVAKRRGISKAWLAWIPVGKDWILGSLSDQYQHLALGQIKSRRKILMVLHLAGFAVGAATFSLGIAQAIAMIAEEPSNALAVAELVPNLLTTAVGIAALVFYHMCNYDLYRSCDPKNAVVYLVVGIVIPITEPFFYLAVRKRDDGMPRSQIEEPLI